MVRQPKSTQSHSRSEHNDQDLAATKNDFAHGLIVARYEPFQIRSISRRNGAPATGGDRMTTLNNATCRKKNVSW
jgi:hypothetical protein